MTPKFFLVALFIGALCVAPFEYVFALYVQSLDDQSTALVPMKEGASTALVPVKNAQSTALVPVSASTPVVDSTNLAEEIQAQKDQVAFLMRLLKIRDLQDQRALRKKLSENLAKDEKNKDLSKKIGDAVKGGVKDSVDFVVDSAVGSTRFLIKIGVVIFIVGFGGTILVRTMADGNYDPFKWLGRTVWGLFTHGTAAGDHVFKNWLKKTT